MNENEYKLEIYVTKDNVTIKNKEKIHTGEYKITKCEFEFTEDYKGLTKKAIFEAEDVIKEMPIISNECDIPEEVLQDGYLQCNLRVYGYDIEEVDGEMTVKLRYSPTYDTFPIWKGSFIPNAEQGEEITPTQFEQYTAALNEGLEEVDNKLVEVDNTLETMNTAIEASEEATERANTISETLETAFEQGDLNGATFIPSVSADGNISWTNDKGLVNPQTQNIRGPQGEQGIQGIQGEQGPQGLKGDTGDTGNGIASIIKTGTSGLVDTYTITFTDGTTTTFDITNGEDGEVSQAQLDETNRMVEQANLVYNALPKVTGSGEEITLNNTAETPLKLTLKGNTYQETTTGKNLASLDTSNTKTIGGVSFTIDDDGVIHINGTPTANASFYFNSFQTNSGSAFFWIEVNGYSSTDSGNDSMIIQQSDDNSTWSTLKELSFKSTTGKSTSTTLDSSKYYRIRWYANNHAYTNATIKVMLEYGTTKTSWEPYTNGASPNPTYPQDIEVVTGYNEIKITGKQLFNYATTNYVQSETTTITGTGNDFTVSSTGYGLRAFYVSQINFPTIYAYMSSSYTSGSIALYVTNNSSYNSWADFGNDRTRIANNWDITQTNSISLANYQGKYLWITLRGSYTDSGYTSVNYKDFILSSQEVNAYVPYQEQTYEINLGKNLFNIQDLVKGRLDNGVIGYDTNTTDLTLNTDSFSFTTNANYRGVSTNSYIPVKPNTTYYLQSETARTGIGMGMACYDSSKTFLSNPTATAVDDYTVKWTTPANASYCRVQIQLNASGTTTITKPQLQQDKISNYSQYFTPIELCKIGDYQDYLYKSGENWYKHSEIGKNTLNIVASALSDGGTFKYVARALSPAMAPQGNQKSSNFFSNKNRFSEQGITNFEGYPAYVISNQFVIQTTTTDTIDNFKQQVNGGIVYYPLATPTEEQITNAELIEQLNNLYYAYAYQEQTNINQSNSNLASIMNAETTRDLSNIFTNE